MPNVFRNGIADIAGGISNWRTWRMLAWNDVRRRYRRSRLGQFWLTLSMAVNIGGLGYVYSHLFSVNVPAYVPYISVTFVAWALISSIITDSCTALSDNEQLLRQLALPRSLFACRVIARNFFIAGHNVLIIPVVFYIFNIGMNLNFLWLIAGLALLTLNGFWVGYLLAIICARFRDVPQIISSVMQVVFFITPIMYLPEQLGQRGIGVLRWNPFAIILEVVRNPILGEAPSRFALVSSSAMAAIGLLLIIPLAGRYATRVIYWL
jgi:ABC-type polysaccharide/polyol phosphate export permease